MKLSQSLNINPNNIRTRSFEMGGQKLRVRIPLALEMEQISEAVENVKWKEKFEEMKKSFMTMDDKDKFEILDDDVLIDGKSLKDLAIMSAKTEQRILRMIQLLVPQDETYDMTQITYDDVEAEFPFAIQVELMKKISEVISPNYEETRKN
jgi:hypothetical protein